MKVEQLVVNLEPDIPVTQKEHPSPVVKKVVSRKNIEHARKHRWSRAPSITRKHIELLQELFYKPEYGATSAVKLHYTQLMQLQKVSGEIQPLTMNQCKTWIEKQKTFQLFKRYTKPKVYNKIPSAYVDNRWQMDIVILQKFSTKNKNFGYLLTVVDVYSKFGWGVPMKTKSSKSCVDALSTVIKQRGRSPQFIQCDNDGAFIAPEMVKLLTFHNTVQSLSDPWTHNRQGVIERFNKTLVSSIYSYFQRYRTLSWIGVISQIVHAYNNMPHRGLGGRGKKFNKQKLTPSMIKEASDAPDAHAALEKTVVHKYLPGDSVRIHIDRPTFGKSYVPSWTEEIYRIDIVNEKNYVLEGQDRRYQQHELQKISVPVEDNPFINKEMRNIVITDALKTTEAEVKLARTLARIDAIPQDAEPITQDKYTKVKSRVRKARVVFGS